VRHWPTIGFMALALLAPAAHADEKDDTLVKQKAAAQGHWTKMEFKKPGAPMLETPNLIVYSRLTEAKTKALAAALDKAYVAATKALQYDSKDVPWPGKLAVFVLPERDEFVEFVRKVSRKAPGEEDTGYSNVSGDVAMIVAGAPRVGTQDAEDEVRAGMTTLLLKRKMGGGTPPDWLASGFARATAARVAKPTAKAMANTPAIAFRELWQNRLAAKDKAILATPLIDYLAYGPGAGMFGDFVGALRADDGDQTPSLKDAAEAIKLDEASLEALVRYWRKPATAKPATAKPAKKPGK